MYKGKLWLEYVMSPWMASILKGGSPAGGAVLGGAKTSGSKASLQKVTSWGRCLGYRASLPFLSLIAALPEVGNLCHRLPSA